MTATQIDPDPGTSAAFRHEAMFYSGDDGFLAGTIPFLTEAIRAEQPALVVLRPPHLALLRASIERSGDHVFFADMTAVGRNPARIIPAWREFLDSHGSDGNPVRGIGEPIWPTRTPAEIVECQRHEALLNIAFATSSPWWLMCPYDVGALAPPVVEEAARSHPYIRQAAGESMLSTAFRAEEMSTTHRSAPLSEPTRCLESITFRAGQLALVRALAETRASQYGLTERQLGDMVLAVHEIAANSIRHGGGQGQFRLGSATWT